MYTGKEILNAKELTESFPHNLVRKPFYLKKGQNFLTIYFSKAIDMVLKGLYGFFGTETKF